MNLRVGRTLERSSANGPGERFVVWVQGCSLACPGCFNPELSDPGGGTEVRVQELAERINKTAGIRGLTLSGGDPLEQAEAVLELLKRLDRRLDVVLFTGFTPQEIASDPAKARILRHVDLMVAGRYERARALENDPWRSSSNQEVVELSGRIRLGEGPGCRVEIFIGPGGKFLLTGLPIRGLAEALRGE
ncbi:MAG: radical SAM protein [Elusimicrobia bacterium]|nr:radical SAM protein [Elusimicrobiota bacterium]